MRELGLRRVLRSRKLCNSVTKIRTSKIPNINFDADNFYEMIDWQNVVVTLPPLLHDVADDVIWRAINELKEHNFFWKRVAQYPMSHSSRAVKRMIKLITMHPAKFVAKKAETVTLKQPYKFEK